MNYTDGRVIQLINRLGNCKETNQLTEEMAKTFNLSTSRLKIIFKEQTGKTILQFDKDLRLDRAKELFETTYKRANEVRDEVGFGDYSHFERDFYRKFGITPSQLQKQSRLKIAMQEIANKSLNSP